MRKKLAALSILLLVLSVLSALNVNMPWVSASASPVIRVADPADLTTPANISGLGIGTIFNVSIYTNYTGSDVWGYEFTLTYNPLVLEIVSPNVTNGDLIDSTNVNFSEFLAGEVDNTEGTLSLTGAHLKGQNVTGGAAATMANVTFNVTAIGDSCLTLGPETKLIGIDAGAEYNIIDNTTPDQIQDGYFYNTASPPTHDLEVTSVTPNATGVLAGEFVEINATVSNAGTVTERFDVNLYYALWLNISIGTETVILPVGSTNVTFTWNTTDVLTGNYTITATAGPVCGETDTTDNTGTHDKVFVMSPIISVIPDSLMDASLTEGETFEVSIYTDYDATLLGRSDVWGYEFTLTFNGTILDVIGVTNGGNLSKTDAWSGDGTTTEFTTTETPLTGTEMVYVGFTDNLTDQTDNITTTFTTTEAPILPGSETVLLNETLMAKPANYTIDYTIGNITFTTAPETGVELIVSYMALMTESDNYTLTGTTLNFTTPPADGALVRATYLYDATLLTPPVTFTPGAFGTGTLSPTSANVSVSALETGPGILATVTFNVTAIGDTDITLGPETRLIGFGSFYNITLPHRLEHGFFTNGIDLKVASVVPSASQANPTWTVPISIDVTVLNVRPMSVGPFNVTVYYVNSSGSVPIGNDSLPGLGAFEEKRLTFNWDISGFDWGLYNITAEITATNDITPANDVLVYSKVTITIPGDIDADGDVDFDDFFFFTGFYPTGYHVDADINRDGLMTFDDFFLFTGFYPRPTAITYTY